MKILKHGETFRFSCNVCGCEWVMGIREKGIAEEKIGDVRIVTAKCPHCGTETTASNSNSVGGTDR